MTIQELIESVRSDSMEKQAADAPVSDRPMGTPGPAGTNVVDGSPAESAAAGEVVQAVMGNKKEQVSAAPDSPMVDQHAATPEDQAVQQADLLQAAAGGDLQARSDARAEEDLSTSQLAGGRMEGEVKAASEEAVNIQDQIKVAVQAVLTEMQESEKTAEEKQAAEEAEFAKMAEDAMAYGAMIADGFVARLSEYQPEE
jgi:hypothetical protein